MTATRWINTVLALIVAFIGFDTLFRLLNANPENVVVSIVRSVSGLFLAPFSNMFADQDYLLTALVAILGYAILAGILVALVNAISSGRTEHTTTTVRAEDDRTRL